MIVITLIVVIALLGLACWALTTLIPMPPKFQQAIYVVAVVFLVLYILQEFELLKGFAGLRIGK